MKPIKILIGKYFTSSNPFRFRSRLHEMNWWEYKVCQYPIFSDPVSSIQGTMTSVVWTYRHRVWWPSTLRYSDDRKTSFETGFSLFWTMVFMRWGHLTRTLRNSVYMHLQKPISTSFFNFMCNFLNICIWHWSHFDQCLMIQPAPAEDLVEVNYTFQQVGAYTGSHMI